LSYRFIVIPIRTPLQGQKRRLVVKRGDKDLAPFHIPVEPIDLLQPFRIAGPKHPIRQQVG
jgi:hypothetical protein